MTYYSSNPSPFQLQSLCYCVHIKFHFRDAVNINISNLMLVLGVLVQYGITLHHAHRNVASLNNQPTHHECAVS